jgi:diaminopimelate decarboxylase
LSELARINEIAHRMGKKVNVALRVNPDIELATHAYIATGKKETKFGIDIPTAEKVFLERARYAQCMIKGIHIHIGSQITEAAPFVRAFRQIRKLIDKLREQGVEIDSLNIGGGLGIVYDKEKPQTADEFAGKVIPLLKGMDLKIILEPGRFIVGNAGILLTKVTYVKYAPQKRFIIVDAGMNDLIRPSLYQAYHTILPVESPKKIRRKGIESADIVGPLCESGDFLGKERTIEAVQGMYLAVFGAGAYGFSMSSQYNSRPRAAEVLVDNKKVYLIRRRETYKDLVAKEILI